MGQGVWHVVQGASEVGEGGPGSGANGPGDMAGPQTAGVYQMDQGLQETTGVH
jgi:hypothetical protein